MRESLLLLSTNIVVYPKLLIHGFTLLYLIRSFRCSIFKVRFYVSIKLALNGFSLSFSEKSLVGTSGFEPPTSRLSGVRSNHLSYAPISSGGDEEDRTPDPLRARQVLSQLSYTPI